MAASQEPENLKERLKAGYDSIAPAYNAWTVKHSTMRHAYLDRLLASLPKLSAADGKPTYLELGCGSGDPFLKTLLSRCPNLVAHANELSDAQLSLAREQLSEYTSRVTFHPGDMTKLTFDEGSFSAVAGLYSIIHLPPGEQVALVKQIYGWLEPGGVLVANFAAEKDDGKVMEKWLGEGGWMYWSGLGVEGTVKTLEDVGFKVERQVVEEEGDDERFLWVIARK